MLGFIFRVHFLLQYDLFYKKPVSFFFNFMLLFENPFTAHVRAIFTKYSTIYINSIFL